MFAGFKYSAFFCTASTDLVGVGYNRVLVHGPVGSSRSVQQLVVRWSAQRLLDDRLLQPSGLFDGDATGDHESSRRLGARRSCAGQRRDQADEGRHHLAAQRRLTNAISRHFAYVVILAVLVVQHWIGFRDILSAKQ